MIILKIAFMGLFPFVLFCFDFSIGSLVQGRGHEIENNHQSLILVIVPYERWTLSLGLIIGKMGMQETTKHCAQFPGSCRECNGVADAKPSVQTVKEERPWRSSASQVLFLFLLADLSKQNRDPSLPGNKTSIPETSCFLTSLFQFTGIRSQLIIP